MPVLAKVTRNFQVTIPKAVREEIGIHEGDFVSVEAREGGVFFRAQKVVDADRAWFWTEEWQAGEREVDEAIARGEVFGPFKTADELMDDIEAFAATLDNDEE